MPPDRAGRCRAGYLHWLAIAAGRGVFQGPGHALRLVPVAHNNRRLCCGGGDGVDLDAVLPPLIGQGFGHAPARGALQNPSIGSPFRAWLSFSKNHYRRSVMDYGIFSLKGKTALVTGGYRGIGKAVAIGRTWRMC